MTLFVHEKKNEQVKIVVYFLGHAKIAGIEKAINLSGTEYNWAVANYFIGFVSAGCLFVTFFVFPILS
jgi:hypothetical protein